MSDLLVARRYANALYQLAEEKHTLDEVDSDVALVADTVAGSKELSSMLVSPVVSREKKKSVVTALFGNRVGKTTLDFVLLLIEKGREQTLPAIAGAYRALRDSQQGVIVAMARTAEPMSSEDQVRLRDALEQKTGKQVRLNVSQDSSVLGGLIVRVGDVVYDGSVRNSLAQLSEHFGVGKVRSN